MTEELIDTAWERAKEVDGCDPDQIRKDCCGALIKRSEYGNRDSQYGWEVDHIFPKSKGGDDNESNLRAMQWENNASKGEDFPRYWSAVKENNNRNAACKKRLIINKQTLETLKQLYNI